MSQSACKKTADLCDRNLFEVAPIIHLVSAGYGAARNVVPGRAAGDNENNIAREHLQHRITQNIEKRRAAVK